MYKFIATILLALFLSTATVFADNAEFDEELAEFMPDDFEKIMQAKKEREEQLQRELVQKIVIGGAVLLVIFIGAKKLGNTRKFQVAKDYFYMLELTKLAKEGNGEKSVVNELYAFCIKREYLREIVNKYNASLNDFEKIYKDLMTYCAAYNGKMFIPVAAFFFVSSLDYILSHRIKSRAAGEKVASVLTDSFDKLNS